MLRSPARLFAPLALVACAVAILMIVNGNSHSSRSKKGTSTTTASSTTTATTPKATGRHRRSYIVKPLDTLSQIAVKTGVPLATLQQLNPNVDAQSLHAGQKIKLAP